MDLGKILDGTPEPILTVPDSIFDSSPSVCNSSGDYTLPVPMTEFQKELTDQVISSHYSDILKFFETDGPVLVESLHTLYMNAQLVATHPFLLVDHYLPKNLLLREVPLRLQHASGKFKILGDLLEIVRDFKLTIALVSRPGKALDLVEAYIQGKFVNYRRHSGSQLRDTGKVDPKYSTLHLIASSELDSNYLGNERFDLVIAFDQTFSITDQHIVSIRSNGRSGSGGTLAPVIRLIPANSIEHIYLKSKLDWDNKHRNDIGSTTDVRFLRRILAGTVVLRGKVGSIPIDFKPIYAQNLKPLSNWLKTCSDGWLLPDIGDIPEYSASDVEKSLLTEVRGDDAFNISEHSSGGANWSSSSTKDGQGSGHSSRKSSLKHERRLTDTDYYNTKRFKRETDPIDSSNDSPISSSFLLQSSTSSGLSAPHHTSVLTHQLLHKLEDLINENNSLKEETKSYRVQSSSRQKEYENLLEEVSEKILIVGELEAKLKSAEHKTERSIADLTRANDKIDQLTESLSVTKSLLQSSSVPEKKLLDEQNATISSLKLEIEKLQSQVESRNVENEYMREEYQKASNAAVDARNQTTELEKQIQELQKKLDSDSIRLKLLSFDEERFQKDEAIKELTAKLTTLEEHLKRVLGSDRHGGNGRSRYTSRASSVPRRTRSPGTTTTTATNTPSTLPIPTITTTSSN